ncbi:MAG: ABC transporter ATP-binding protein, partial [Clostridiales bacterium]|nr:ABC transporter ATP-binding protein [Clostridiales bacterium]
MSRWLKSLKPYKGMLLGIVLLLIIEAFCDLTLPDLTSKIIDTGIQISGVELVLPEKITKSEDESAKIFMNDEE